MEDNNYPLVLSTEEWLSKYLNITKVLSIKTKQLIFEGGSKQSGHANGRTKKMSGYNKHD